ncbi:MAG: zinc ribbon domain-containing protein [Acidobacteriota bacterium]|nr:zinc ribbon domain-containing protein [Acidobacteriota bacterium]
MPIFEYQCRDCGTRFEKFLASRDEEITCKTCSSPRVDQQLSVFAVAGQPGSSEKVSEPGPCACGAPRRGMCGG